MCEEACPVEAIELTGLYDLTGLSREQMIFDKTKLLSVFDVTKEGEPMRLRPAARSPMPPTANWWPSTSADVVARTRFSPRRARTERVDMISSRDLILAIAVVVLGATGTYLLLPHKHGAVKPRSAHIAGAILAGLALLLFASFWKAPSTVPHEPVLLRIQHRGAGRRPPDDHQP